MQRRKFITLLGGTAAWPLAARAQQPVVPVIGFLNNSSPDSFPDRMRAYSQGLDQAGFNEGRNVAIEYRWAGGQYDRLPALAADLVRRNVNVIAAIGGPTIALAAKASTTTIPIVFQVGVDPVRSGLVASLNHPGGNVTGLTSLNVDVGPKRLELLHELVPAATIVALFVNSANPINAERDATEAQKSALTLGVELHVLQVSDERDFTDKFGTLVQLGAGALLLGTDALFTSRSEQLAALAFHHMLPTISPYRRFAVAGGLASYGGDITESWRLAGVYTARVLKGEKPVDLPVIQSTKVELVINLKTAKALGIAVSLPLQGRADEVIE